MSKLMVAGNLVEKADTISIKEFIDEYRNDKDLLEIIIDNYGDLNNFDSPQWVFFNKYTNACLTINFSDFDELVRKQYMTNDDINLIRCYVMESIKEGLKKITLTRKVKTIYNLAEATNFFEDSFIESFEEEALANKLAKLMPNGTDLSSIIDYFEFLERLDYATKGQLMVLSAFTSSQNYFELSKAARELPSHTDIFSFDYYLKKFFKEEVNEISRGLYMPVLLWWKITNVIPMRPSEITYELDRDCTGVEDGKYFLKVNRVKINDENLNKKNKRPSIPLLKTIGISKEIYDLIEEYKNITAFDNETESLFSYKAYKIFKSKYNKNIEENDIDEIDVEYSQKRFIRSYLQRLINLFCKDIIEGVYKDNSIIRIPRIGDTRHLAFCSLMLQGLSPIEIAMLGGHTSLYSQDHYVGHSKYYMDAEVLQFISDVTSGKEVTHKTLKSIVFSKPKQCPKKLSECIKTDDSIGYCTADILSGGEICETERSCIFCSKWWCYPDNDNFVKAQQYLKTNSLEPLQQKLDEEEEFLRKLLKEAKVVTVSNLVEMEKSCQEEIASKSLKIRSTAQEIVFLKKTLLSLNNASLIKE